MILVLIVISPVMKLVHLDDDLDYYLSANEYSMQASEFKNDVNRMDQEQSDAIFAEYKEKIRSQVEGILSEEMVKLDKFDVTLDQDPASQSFGDILSMNITGSVQKEAGGQASHNDLLENIEIDRIVVAEPKDNESSRVPSPMEIHIKNKLSDFYNIEQGNINISIQGE